MKLLSLWAPWGQLIALGAKDVENRPWSTSYRGPVAIQCTKAGWSMRDAREQLIACVNEDLISMDVARAAYRRLGSDRGCIIATADIAGCSPGEGHPSPWANAATFALELGRVCPVNPPLPATGARGLTDLDPTLAQILGFQRTLL